jgi:hypothetical protein
LFCVEEKKERYVALECEGVVAAAISRFLLSLLETFWCVRELSHSCRHGELRTP